MAEEKKLKLEDLKGLNIKVKEVKDLEASARPVNHVGH